jgi:hypothetical protein
MSSALTGNKIKDSYQALLKMGTNGSLDPITPIVISDGLGNDTPLLLSGIEFKTQVVSASKNYGLSLDLSSNSHVYLGDYNTQYNGTSLYLSDFNQLIQTYGLGGQSIGLKLDFANNLYYLGDYTNVSNGAQIYIDNGNGGIFLYAKQNSFTQLLLDGNNQEGYLNSRYIEIGDANYNNTKFIVSDFSQLIKTTSNNNDIGLKLDFANDLYQFGDFNGVNFYGQLSITNGESVLVSDDNNLGLYGPSLNTVLGYLPGSININDPSANSNNYVFGSDWLMDNDDVLLYPFKYNTVLNCYNSGLDTSDKSMKYNLFVNIQDGGFALRPNVEYDSNIANCFIFGLTDFLGSNSLQMWTDEQVPTNVIVLNGSQLDYGSLSNNIFSANASNVVIGEESTGIHIIGGDFKDKGNILPSSHVIANAKRGIIIEGRGAGVRNDFVKVTAEKFYQTTPSVVGQVQVQEKQFFMYYPDGSLNNTLKDTIDNPEFYLPNSSSNAVNIKLVSTTGSGDVLDTGNSYIERSYLVLVDNAGSVTYDGYCTLCVQNPNNATKFEVSGGGSGYFIMQCAPDDTNGNPCWVKALVTVNTITI